MTSSEIVARSQAKKISEGGALVRVLLAPDAAQALDTLMASGYGASRVAVVSRALLDAAARTGEPNKKDS